MITPYVSITDGLNFFAQLQWGPLKNNKSFYAHKHRLEAERRNGGRMRVRRVVDERFDEEEEQKEMSQTTIV